MATSESMLLIVGLTKSVVVTIISGMKYNLNRKESSFFSLTLDKNLVFVWKVVQGMAQGDFSSPVKICIQCSPGKHGIKFKIISTILFWAKYTQLSPNS